MQQLVDDRERGGLERQLHRRQLQYQSRRNPHRSKRGYLRGHDFLQSPSASVSNDVSPASPASAEHTPTLL
jgi:hypothetical protein